MADEKEPVRKAEYPEKSCRESVYNQHGMGYACELVDYHPGPCASFSVSSLIMRRQAWEDANPEWRKAIGSSDTIV